MEDVFAKSLITHIWMGQSCGKGVSGLCFDAMEFDLAQL